MSRLTSLAPVTLAAFGLFATSSHAQDETTKPVDANSRVTRCLKTLIEARNYAFRTSMTGVGSANGPFAVLRQLGGQQQNAEPAPDVTEGVRVGTTVLWTRDDGETVLANRGRTWITKDRDDNWIPGRRPLGEWTSRYLPDPEFLASGLLHATKNIKWELAGPDEIDEKPVRLYKAVLEGDAAKYLLRTQTLPQSGAFSNAMARIVVVAAGGQKVNVPEPEAKIEVRIYEDPAKHMPLRITADLWIKNQGGIGGVFVQAGGGGIQLGQQNANKNEDDKKKKPTMTVSLDLSKVGEAKADVLDDEAKTLLGK